MGRYRFYDGSILAKGMIKLKNNKTKYNKVSIYQEQIYDKVNELKLLCNEARIPMFFACAVANTDKKTTYETEFISAESNNIHLKDDKITDFINVVNGFTTSPPHEAFEIDMDMDLDFNIDDD